MNAPLSLSEGAGAEVVWSEIVSSNYFYTLGLRPHLGRSLLPMKRRGPVQRRMPCWATTCGSASSRETVRWLAGSCV